MENMCGTSDYILIEELKDVLEVCIFIVNIN